KTLLLTMAKKNCLVTFLICIFLFVNLCFASEKLDSSSNDESGVTNTQNNIGLDYWHPWYHPRPWLRPRPRPHPHPYPHWPFVHPPMPSGGFHPKFPWPFMHPPKSSPPKN
ncbi:hypothetical protein AABB24_036498, partial [Solanum stoloniferum]